MTRDRKLNQFDLPKLIITEGEDDANFIYSFLKKINAELLKSTYIHWVGGNTKLFCGDKKRNAEYDLFGLKQMIINKNFKDYVQNIAVIFDAENSAKNSFDSIIEQFKKANQKSKELGEYQQKIVFNLPSKVGEFLNEEPKKLSPNIAIFLFDKGDGSGTLEDLYLSTLNDKDNSLIQECITEKLIGCLDKKGIKINNQKVKVQTFLAIEDPTLKSIGYAATSDKIDFEKSSSSMLKDLKKFLLDFANLNLSQSKT